MIWRAVDEISTHAPIHVTALHAIAISAALLLAIGLWTPMAGAVLGLIEMFRILWSIGDERISILLGAIAVALALVGPGFWSLDARLYGWKVVKLPPSKE